MDECLFASVFAALPDAAKLHHGENAGGVEMVWKWSGFPGARARVRVYDRSRHSDSPGGEPKSVQNRSGFRGGRICAL